MKIIHIKSCLILGVLLFSQSCTSDFEKLNTPPTSLSTIDPGLIFSRVQKGATFVEGYEYPKINTVRGFSIGLVAC